MKNSTRVLVGSAGVSAVVAGVALTGGTSAYFYDAGGVGVGGEACTLELDLRQPVTASVNEGTGGTEVVRSDDGASVSFANLEPGDSVRVVATARNAGDCAGDMYAQLGDLEGDDAFLDALVVTDARQFGVTRRQSAPLTEVAGGGPVALGATGAGQTQRLTLAFEVPLGERGDGNEIQGTTFAFDLDLGLVQTGQSPGTDLDVEDEAV
ncbi:hypothetical protein WDZ17_10170 [Pseudokineococcus basanitobsidens]|uniref:Camelysin-like metallo-endopeptidase n=1 Tax=Pseudokineococcus basanitobsidens TaxID=1926649 RepID=A0ABU8RKN8_9ACTN